MTKEERLKLEKVQLKADIAEHNRKVRGGSWEDRNEAEKKMYPHRRLTKKSAIPKKDQEPQWINTPRKSRSLKEQQKKLLSHQNKGELTKRGHEELDAVNKAVKKRKPKKKGVLGFLEERGLTGWGS